MDPHVKQRIQDLEQLLLDSKSLNREQKNTLKNQAMIIIRELKSHVDKKNTALQQEVLQKIEFLHKDFCFPLPSKIKQCPVHKIDQIQCRFTQVELTDIIFPITSMAFAFEKDTHQNLIQTEKQPIDSSKNYSKNISQKSSRNISRSTRTSVLKNSTKKTNIKFMDKTSTAKELMLKTFKKPPRAPRNNEKNIAQVFVSENGTPLILSQNQLQILRP